MALFLDRLATGGGSFHFVLDSLLHKGYSAHEIDADMSAKSALA
jgi:hypothetical protein